MAGAPHIQGLKVFVHAHRIGGGVKAQIRIGIAGHEGRRIGALDEVLPCQMIKAQDMRLKIIRALHEVAGNASVMRRGDAGGVFQRHTGGQSMRHGADAADALGNLGSVARVAAFHNGFKTAVHAAGKMGVNHLSVFHLHFRFKVAFDTSNRIDGNGHGLGHISS